MGKLNGTYLKEKEKPELIYVYDALCGWCYGFSPVISKLETEFRLKADFLVLSGGMVRNENAGPISQIAPYIKQAYKVVESTCGVVFGDKFLKDVLEKGDSIFSSVPPACALAVFRMEKPDKAIEFATRLQKAIYYDGMITGDYETYGELAAEFGLDSQSFITQMNSDATAKMVQDEFMMVKGLDVNGYPTLLLKKGTEIGAITRGYRDYESVASLLNDAL